MFNKFFLVNHWHDILVANGYVLVRDGVKYVFAFVVVFEIQQSSYLYLPNAKVTYLYLHLVYDSNTGQIHHFYLRSEIKIQHTDMQSQASQHH